MIKYGVFNECKPRTKEQAILAGKGVLFLKDEEGNCWYDIAAQAVKDKQCVVLLDSNNVVCGFNSDATQMFPNGYSVVLTPKLPEYMQADGLWTLVGDSFAYSREKSVAIANQRKTAELTNVATLLQMYRDILSKEELNPTALAAVEKLELYRDLLLAVDVTRAPSIDWPSQPVL